MADVTNEDKVGRVLRVYSDGAARGNPGPAGAGAVLTDTNGRVLERLGRFLGIQTNNYAEYQGLLLGLERARELGVHAVEIYADSELMIRQLNGEYRVKSPSLRPLFEEAQALLRGFSHFRLTHVRREQNVEADEMSNRAIDERLQGRPLAPRDE
ncbi:MAG: ribonuclease HI family protein [Myxococcaceae bacterium]|nr:ribonuclease HI family protein [Myxococcaceae bacterium]MCI0670044.1 ribonuclease HI family protein [Myxococcaceae bacterium]